ncbi:MAG: hypothetical protein IJS33_01470 [Firmicutes bacterium]|nr:hypothetical protein [Bacillota bacterium]
MTTGHFYFITDAFYDALPNCNLMTNKGEVFNRGEHGRPCHYCFEHKGYYWMVPISSKIEKFENIYNRKVEKRGYCDTIRFGYVNGKKRAFLIQNCFPVTAKYIDEEYKINAKTIPVVADAKLSEELNKLLLKVIRLHAQGINMPLTDLTQIISFLNS